MTSDMFCRVALRIPMTSDSLRIYGMFTIELSFLTSVKRVHARFQGKRIIIKVFASEYESFNDLRVHKSSGWQKYGVPARFFLKLILLSP